MTREEVKEELLDYFKGKDVKIEELENSALIIRIETEVTTKIFYLLNEERLVFTFYIKTDHSQMSDIMTNAFTYSQINWIVKSRKSIRFMLDEGYMSIDF